MTITSSFSGATGVFTFTSDAADDRLSIDLTTSPGVINYDDGAGVGQSTQANVTQVVFIGDDGNDSLFVRAASSGGAQGLSNGIIFDGGAGSNYLSLTGGNVLDFTQSSFVGSGPNAGTYNFSGTGSLTPVNVTFTNVQLVDDTMRAGSFNATGTTGDDDIFVGGGPVLTPDILFQQGPVIIDGGDRDDIGHGSSTGGSVIGFDDGVNIIAHDTEIGVWSMEPNANIENATTRPHLSVVGTGNGTIDFIHFRVTQPNTLGTFDIDASSGSGFDPYIALYDSTGAVLETDDDGLPGTDAGSTTSLDSEIQDYLFTTPGDYYIGVTDLGAFATNGGFSPGSPVLQNGWQYTLHLSVENHAFTAGSAATVTELEPNSITVTRPPANVDGWKYIEQCVDFLHTNSFNNAPNDILGVGIDLNSQAWDALESVADALNLNVTYVNNLQIQTVDFEQYKVIYVPSNQNNTSGGIRGNELDIMAGRRADIQDYVRNGGGIFALTDSFTPATSGVPYAWLQIPAPFTISTNVNGVADLRKTQAAIDAGLTISDAELSNGVPYHNSFTGPIGFNGLDPFVYDAGMDNVAGNGDDEIIALGQGALQDTTTGGPTTQLQFGSTFGSLVLNIGQKTSMTLQALAGDDNVIMNGNTNSLDGMVQPILITGGPGANTVIMSDGADLTGDTVVISGVGIGRAQISGLASAAVTIQSFGVVQMSATSGDDTITTQNLLSAGIGRLIIDGGAGADAIGSAAAPMTVSNALETIVIGGAQADSLTLNTVGLAGLGFVDVPGGRVITQDNARFLFFGVESTAAVVEPGITTNLGTGDLLAIGSPLNDTTVFYRGTAAGTVLVKHRVQGQPFRTYGPFNVTGKIVAEGGAGADYFELNRTLAGTITAELRGGLGSDTLLGGDQADWLVGGGGNDRLLGFGGADTLWGDTEATLAANNRVGINTDGDDVLLGGTGADKLFGGGGKDTLLGGDGDDYLQGGLGNDVLRGEVGNDLLRGDDDNDNLDGGVGADILDGGNGSDTLAGRAGRDIVIGGRGADTLVDDDTDEDILISEQSSYDVDNGAVAALGSNDLALQAILLEWVQGTVIGTRRTNIQNGGGANGGSRLSTLNGTLLFDTSVDTVAGINNATPDWIFVRLVDNVSGNNANDILDES